VSEARLVILRLIIFTYIECNVATHDTTIEDQIASKLAAKQKYQQLISRYVDTIKFKAFCTRARKNLHIFGLLKRIKNTAHRSDARDHIQVAEENHISKAHS